MAKSVENALGLYRDSEPHADPWPPTNPLPITAGRFIDRPAPWRRLRRRSRSPVTRGKVARVRERAALGPKTYARRGNERQ